MLHMYMCKCSAFLCIWGANDFSGFVKKGIEKSEIVHLRFHILCKLKFIDA